MPFVVAVGGGAAIIQRQPAPLANQIVIAVADTNEPPFLIAVANHVSPLLDRGAVGGGTAVVQGHSAGFANQMVSRAALGNRLKRPLLVGSAGIGLLDN